MKIVISLALVLFVLQKNEDLAQIYYEAYDLVFENPLEAIRLSKAGIQESHIENDDIELEFYKILANAYLEIGSIEDAINAFSSGIVVGERKFPRSIYLGDLYAELGQQFNEVNEFEKSDGLYKKALKIYSKEKDIVGQVGIMNNLGLLYISSENFPIADSILRDGINVLKKISISQSFNQDDKNESLAMLYTSLAEVQRKSKELGLGEDYDPIYFCKQALNYLDDVTINDENEIIINLQRGSIYLIIASAYLLEDLSDSINIYLDLSYVLVKDDDSKLATYYLIKGQSVYARNSDLAIEFFEKSYDLAKKNQYYNDRIEVLDFRIKNDINIDKALLLEESLLNDSLSEVRNKFNYILANPKPYKIVFNIEQLDKYLGIGGGAIFMIVILVFAFFGKRLNEQGFWIVRITMSISIAAVGAAIPGFLQIEIGENPYLIRAGGALGLFVLTYLINPPALKRNSKTPKKSKE